MVKLVYYLCLDFTLSQANTAEIPEPIPLDELHELWQALAGDMEIPERNADFSLTKSANYFWGNDFQHAMEISSKISRIQGDFDILGQNQNGWWLYWWEFNKQTDLFFLSKNRWFDIIPNGDSLLLSRCLPSDNLFFGNWIALIYRCFTGAIQNKHPCFFPNSAMLDNRETWQPWRFSIDDLPIQVSI